MTTIFVCDDQKAKYSQGICAKPNEQQRARFSLWFAYAVDVATDLAGTYGTGGHGQSLLTGIDSNVSTFSTNLESTTTKHAEVRHLRAIRQRLGLHCEWSQASPDRLVICLTMMILPAFRHSSCRASRSQGRGTCYSRSEMAANVDGD